MTVVVNGYAIVDPGAVTMNRLARSSDCDPSFLHSLILLRHTSIASLTMLASQRPSHHTRHAEVGFVELAKREQFIDDALLAITATSFGNKTGIFLHSFDVEEAAETVENEEEDVEEGMVEE